MNIILLSGGSGKRLWPLSNDVRSKQFIKLFKNKDKYESMVQRVYRQITTIDADAKITIATSKSQASSIKNQLGEKTSICVEPCRRDTFPAIVLAVSYLHDELGVALCLIRHNLCHHIPGSHIFPTTTITHNLNARFLFNNCIIKTNFFQ